MIKQLIAEVLATITNLVLGRKYAYQVVKRK